MSRVAKSPVELPKGVEFKQNGNVVTLKGGNGELSIELNSEVEIKHEENALTLTPRSGSRFSSAIAGTMRAIIANMAKGVLSRAGAGQEPEPVARILASGCLRGARRRQHRDAEPDRDYRERR